jgi:hypothetical protein
LILTQFNSAAKPAINQQRHSATTSAGRAESDQYPRFLIVQKANSTTPLAEVIRTRMPLRPCRFWRSPDDEACAVKAFYCLELVSRQGPRCQTAVCREHVHHAWTFGQRELNARFPGRDLKLSSIRLMPFLEKKSAKRPRQKAAGAGSE